MHTTLARAEFAFSLQRIQNLPNPLDHCLAVLGSKWGRWLIPVMLQPNDTAAASGLLHGVVDLVKGGRVPAAEYDGYRTVGRVACTKAAGAVGRRLALKDGGYLRDAALRGSDELND